MRSSLHQYQDPLDHIWLDTAKRIGLKVVRSADTFASTDGHGVLTIATAEHLDPDDCVAQMILHELCHSLVEGETAFAKSDWGLCNQSERDVAREHACLRVQATLLSRFGLSEVLAPTTDFREFYDRVSGAPLEPVSEESVRLAKRALRHEATAPWSPHIERALQATRVIVEAASQFRGTLPSPLLLERQASPPRHPTGLPGSSEHPCGSCAWRNDQGHCQQADRAVSSDLSGCERFESQLDCLHCGACCRSAYDSVTVDAGDRVVTEHPELVIQRDSYIELRRKGDRCVALQGDIDEGTPMVCQIYSDRPTCCREFERQGPHCLTARRRVGLSL